MYVEKEVSLDKIIAVESLLNQIQIMNDFGYERLALVEDRRNKGMSIENELRNLFGSEEQGVVTLYKAPGIVQSRFNVSDSVRMEQSWKTKNIYDILIVFETGSIRLIYKVESRIIAIV